MAGAQKKGKEKPGGNKRFWYGWLLGRITTASPQTDYLTTKSYSTAYCRNAAKATAGVDARSEKVTVAFTRFGPDYFLGRC